MARCTMPTPATPPCRPRCRDVVAAIRGLNDFRLRPKAKTSAARRERAPDARLHQLQRGEHYLAPDDFATVFNLNPLYNSGIMVRVRRS